MIQQQQQQQQPSILKRPEKKILSWNLRMQSPEKKNVEE